MSIRIISSDSDDDDSDMEVLAQLSDWDTDSDAENRPRAHPRQITRVNYMQSLDDAEFTFRFRLSKPVVNSLLHQLMPNIRVTSTRNHGVSPLHQLLLTLRFYALGTMLISVADFVGVSTSTAGRIVKDISAALANLYDEYIVVHQQSAEKFYQIARFPRVLAAIDCTHIRIQSPCRIIGEEFRNRKGYFSLNVQAICDADLKFMDVVARWPGSTHDATIFNNSVLREVTVTYRRGLPVITVPLPSRRELCRFTLRPVSQTVGDLLEQVKAEDRGVERAVALAADERIRIAASDTVESLLETDFRLIINDIEYYVKSPPQERLSTEEITRLSDVRNLVNQLYEALNVREHQIRKERELRSQLEKLTSELQPLEEKRISLEMETTRRTSALVWVGLGLMGVQFGVLARLTWWEYSWDIMEPVTYFVTYGTAMAVYAYFVLTKQEYILPDVKDRQHLLMLHKRAKKIGLDINHYNHLKDEVDKLQKDLARLRDPLQIHLPTQDLKGGDDKRSPLTKIKDMLEETGKKMKIT